jgi:signal transduction histidine kinase
VPVRIEELPAERLPDVVEVAVYFLVAESVTNAVKHARPGQVTVRVTRDDESVAVEIADDGVGGATIEGSTGLRGLADRVAALGGQLQVESPPGAGTRVVASIPTS